MITTVLGKKISIPLWFVRRFYVHQITGLLQGHPWVKSLQGYRRPTGKRAAKCDSGESKEGFACGDNVPGLRCQRHRRVGGPTLMFVTTAWRRGFANGGGKRQETAKPRIKTL